MNKTGPTISPQTNRSGARRPIRWAVALLLVVVAIGIFASGVRPESFALWIDSLGLERSGFGARITFFFIALILVSAVLPKTVVSLSAGALFGTYTGGVLITLISVVAAILNYAIGRWWFRDSIASRMDETQKGHSPAWMTAIHGMSAEAGYGAHLLLRFASIPSMLLNYFMGAVGARIAPFMTAAVIGILPQLLWVHSGAIASVANDQISTSRWASTLLSLVAAIIVTVLLPREILKRIRAQQACEKSPKQSYTQEHSASNAHLSETTKRESTD